MNIIEAEKDPEYCFAAVKLIEQLFADGLIPDFMFGNILNEYADIIDISKFTSDNIRAKENTA